MINNGSDRLINFISFIRKRLFILNRILFSFHLELLHLRQCQLKCFLIKLKIPSFAEVVEISKDRSKILFLKKWSIFDFQFGNYTIKQGIVDQNKNGKWKVGGRVEKLSITYPAWWINLVRVRVTNVKLGLLVSNLGEYE